MYDIIYNITGGGCWGGLEDEDSPCQHSQCVNFAWPREGLYLFLVGLYGEYIVPSAFHLINLVLRKPKLILSCSDKGVNIYVMSNEMLEKVWTRIHLCDSLSL